MYVKLAVRNVKRQMGDYLIYFMTMALTVALLFAINHVLCSKSITVFVNRDDSLKTLMTILVVTISAVVAFVLGYANSFLLKRRKREFGMYLTLGMGRRDLLAIFLTETCVICVGALGAGLAAGLFIYQGMMAVMMKILEMEFAVASYSAEGLLHTIVLTVGIFLLSSVSSAFYLQRVSIYDLLHGETKVEKGVRHPFFWLFVTLASILLMLWCGPFRRITALAQQGGTAEGMEILFAGFIAAVVLFHVGLSKSAVYLLLRMPRFCSRGSNTFVLRQLSGSLSANSLMFGCLALLMSLSVIGANVSFMQKESRQEALLSEYPCDIMYYCNRPDGGKEDFLKKAESLISEYAGIADSCTWRIYETGRLDFYSRTRWFEEGMAPNDAFMSQSDFNALMEALGAAPVSLDGQFLVVCNHKDAALADWSDMVWEHGGRSYTCSGARTDVPKLSYLYFYVVVPDEALADMECVEENRAYLTKEQRYDGKGLKMELEGLMSGADEPGNGTKFEIREYRRQEENDISAVVVVGLLFAAGVFLLLALAILALKMLSAFGEDKRRYEICFRLGMGTREQEKALFRQTFIFFLFPFVMPMALSVPVAALGVWLMRFEKLEASAKSVPLITGVVAAVIASLYLLYYMAAYLIARRTVVRSGE